MKKILYTFIITVNLLFPTYDINQNENILQNNNQELIQNKYNNEKIAFADTKLSENQQKSKKIQSNKNKNNYKKIFDRFFYFLKIGFLLYILYIFLESFL